MIYTDDNSFLKSTRDIYLLFLVLSISLFTTDSLGQVNSASAEITVLQSKWITDQKGKVPPVFLYNEASGLFVNDSLNIGSIAINKALFNQSKNLGVLVRYDTLGTYQLHKGQVLILGVYTTSLGRKIPSIIAWRKETTWTKAFEVIAEKSKQLAADIAGIDVLRSSWELYSNQHRPDLIVRNVFAVNGRYFYNGIENKGIEIAEAYGYMKNETYTIDLTPLKVYQVNERMIYEIGVYKTNGEGLYFLLWTKEGDDWKLLLDFNF